jgi:hypothetical protein
MPPEVAVNGREEGGAVAVAPRAPVVVVGALVVVGAHGKLPCPSVFTHRERRAA